MVGGETKILPLFSAKSVSCFEPDDIGMLNEKTKTKLELRNIFVWDGLRFEA